MEAARALSALGHETRLAIFRILVQAGPSGVAAGDIARELDLAPNALSFHLKDLAHAGLIAARQEGRYLIYSANFQSMNAVVSYLMENCCGGTSCDKPAAAAQPKNRRSKR
jgi:ArsR family transcriptional regulator